MIVGVATAFHSAAIPRVRASGLTPSQFVIAPLVSILLFAIFVGLGLALRRRAAIHKRFMVLAMIAVIGPAVGRLLTLIDANVYGYIVQPMVTAAFVVWCLIYDWRRNRLVHPASAIGGLIIVVSLPLKLMVARSEWWQPIGAWIANVGAGL